MGAALGITLYFERLAHWVHAFAESFWLMQSN